MTYFEEKTLTYTVAPWTTIHGGMFGKCYVVMYGQWLFKHFSRRTSSVVKNKSNKKVFVLHVSVFRIYPVTGMFECVWAIAFNLLNILYWTITNSKCFCYANNIKFEAIWWWLKHFFFSQSHCISKQRKCIRNIEREILSLWKGFDNATVGEIFTWICIKREVE